MPLGSVASISSFAVALWSRLGAGISEIGGLPFMTATMPCSRC